METKRLKKSRYISGLDGVRTLAVLGVIFYHLLPDKMRGGYLGVPVFFAISGYLISDHLRLEWEEKGKISLKAFFGRRLKRLYPPMLFFLVVTTAYITLFQRNLLNNLKGVVTSALLYVNNWWQINQGMSYFERFTNESPFTHIWYLSVEFQNYLIWPILFVLLMTFVKNRKKIFLVVFAGALLSAVLMAVDFVPGADPTRVYYGTDTRIFSIWLGSAMAFLWPSTHLRPKIPQQAKRVLNTVGLVSLALLLVSFFIVDAHYTFVYRGGMFLISLIAVFLIMIVVHPGASLNKWLTNPVFTYIGKRSYGIYLYQYPVMIFYEAKVKNIADHLWLHTLIEIILILVCAEISYRLIDRPLRNFDYSKTWSTVKGWFKKPILSRQKPFLIPGLLLVLVALTGFVIAPSNHVTAEQKQMQEQILKNREVSEATKKEAQKAKETADSGTSGTAETTDSSSEELDPQLQAQRKEMESTYGLSEEQVAAAYKLKFTAFGDSVMLGAAQNMKDLFPKAVVDANVNRQVYSSVDLVKQLDTQGLLNDPVIVGLGTNGDFNDSQFADFMAALGDRKVYWVNVHAPSVRTQNVVNSSLTNLAKKYDNLTIIDWHTYASNGNASWFYDDGVHLTPEGRIAYTKLLFETLTK
ncbi:acyltransferase family protein [Candidatus Enterococcus leclercqii]|uniref:acyltransferase family protein n=1 Tax=Candidatus Enterococcus leclercqii TaxID=1857218 RepID=UPI00137A6D64|nr:acyltransferase family protein [Enterococcus sp. CU9D]KAF1294383.1 acyltransferase [Enterococcus sp. CU9D]